jgi:hypothetical protein
MKKPIIVFALMLSQTAAAGEIIIATGGGFVPVSVRMDKKADHVAVPLTVETDIEKPAERVDAMNTAIETIRAAVSADPDLKIEIGVVSLSPSGSRSKFSSSSSYGSGRSSAKLYALGALSDRSDVFSQTKKIYQAMHKLALPRDVSVRLGDTTLGIRDPEDYRGQLLNMIRDQVEATKEAMGASGSVTVRGLEGSVLVTQKNDADVSLYLTYRIDISME